jgi:hypothetical protein
MALAQRAAWIAIGLTLLGIAAWSSPGLRAAPPAIDAQPE